MVQEKSEADAYLLHILSQSWRAKCLVKQETFSGLGDTLVSQDFLLFRISPNSSSNMLSYMQAFISLFTLREKI